MKTVKCEFVINTGDAQTENQWFSYGFSCFTCVQPFTCNSNCLTKKNVLSEECDTVLSDQRQENSALVSSFEKLVVTDQNKRSLGLHK